MTRYLIVNADDFGATHGINRGIIEAFRRGIVTSTSLMVTTPASEEAAELARGVPGLGVGLHVDLDTNTATSIRDIEGVDACEAELRRQWRRFEEMTGGRPTHLDSHHNSHRDPRLLPSFLRVARDAGVPLREHSPARYFPAFYGRWGGETHAEQIEVDSLLDMFDAEVGDGITELSCHPGYVDDALHSDYAVERELELRTLCDPAVARAVRDRGIVRVDFRGIERLAPAGARGDA